MTETIKHFLLVFDHANATLIEMTEFGSDVDRALREYAAREETYRNDLAIDIVLVGSDSLDTVQVTHANYFGGAPTSPFLAGLGRN
jgi:hypothetical protein